MKNLNANVKLYLGVQKDIETAKAELIKYSELLSNSIAVIVSSTLTISRNSTEKQFIYGVSILNNMINGCKILNIDTSNLKEDIQSILNLRILAKEFTEWSDYTAELNKYSRDLYALLSNEDKISLLKYPKK